MYIVAIAWIYVALMLAISQSSLFLGLLSFIFLGLLPSSILLWMSASKVRRQRARYREALRQSLPDQKTGQSDGSNTQ